MFLSLVLSFAFCCIEVSVTRLLSQYGQGVIFLFMMYVSHCVQSISIFSVIIILVLVIHVIIIISK